MKIGRIILLVLIGAVAFSCKINYPVAQQGGKEDVAYLLFVSNGEIGKGWVQVFMDQAPAFKAKTVKSKKANRKGTAYSVAPGRRKIKVVYEGRVLYQKVLFLSAQETKAIQLP